MNNDDLPAECFAGIPAGLLPRLPAPGGDDGTTRSFTFSYFATFGPPVLALFFASASLSTSLGRQLSARQIPPKVL